MLTQTEQLLFLLLNQSLHGKSCNAAQYKQLKQNWKNLSQLAKSQSVISLIYDPIEKQAQKEEQVPDFFRYLTKEARTTVRSNYRLLFLTKYVTELLTKHGIQAIVLKGCATASFYPTPELRKSGDVDILIPNSQDFKRACNILLQEGMSMPETQLANHHVEFKNNEGISVELHSSLVEDFEKKHVNQKLQKMVECYGTHVEENTTWGFSFYQPTDAYHAYYLLLHMLQHFMRAGFGVKFLCDWVVFWNRHISLNEKKIFCRLIKETGIDGFARMITAVCVEYLGLPEKRVSFLLKINHPLNKKEVEAFAKEMLAAGEFGRDDRTRMVILPGTGITAYIKEFHHQMCLNYPKASNFFVLWPVLWSATLYRFIYNNRTLRKIKGTEILREAGRRSKLVTSMQIFKK